jgi:hypothetical protein
MTPTILKLSRKEVIQFVPHLHFTTERSLTFRRSSHCRSAISYNVHGFSRGFFSLGNRGNRPIMPKGNGQRIQIPLKADPLAPVNAATSSSHHPF